MLITQKIILFSTLDNLIKRLILRYLTSKSKKINNYRKNPLVVFGNDWIGANIYVDGVYEKKFIEDIFDIFKKFRINPKKGYALDIGANIGNHSLQFSKKFKGVFAFEPHKRVFEVLKLNTKKIKNIRCVNLAIGNKIGKIKFRDYNENYGASHVVSNNKKKNYFIVNVSKLSNLVKKLNPIYYIKIDTEGMEYQVLKSGKDIINKFKPIISIEQKKSEFKPKFRETASIDFLRSLGYEIYTSKETFKTNNFILKKLVLIYGLFHKVSILRGIVKLKNVQKKNYSFLIAIHKNYILKS
tara:strand:+ start:140 stop:1033 length:894 start_codon:yes stop_codon:yes gene_type:complete